MENESTALTPEEIIANEKYKNIHDPRLKIAFIDGYRSNPINGKLLKSLERLLSYWDEGDLIPGALEDSITKARAAIEDAKQLK